jgi:NADH:ubiquinone oxidoreductase subunit 5 (subunit L)/multisubunit Na+/H+ antiporter MnhA subunit
MPWMAFFLVFFTLSSIGLPGLNGFIGEILVLLGTAASQHETGGLGLKYAVVAASGIVLGAIYMLYMAGRVLFGPLVEPPHTPDTAAGLSPDLTFREIGILTPLALLCVWIGVYPSHLLSSIQPALQNQVIARVLVEPERGPAGQPVVRTADVSPDDPRLQRHPEAVSDGRRIAEMLRFAQHDNVIPRSVHTNPVHGDTVRSGAAAP